MFESATDRSPLKMEAVLTGWVRIAVAAVLGFAAMDWVGWATGIEELTRGFASWPQMTPWTALLVAMLAVAILVQSGNVSPTRVRIGRGLAVVVGLLAVAFLAEYATAKSFGLDQVWFHDTVRALQATWPGRPSPQTGLSVLLLSAGVVLTRVDRRWSTALWAWTLLAAMALPFVVAGGYLLQVLSVVGVTRSTGMGISTSAALLLLAGASLAARPDRQPLAWLLARPDGRTLLRMTGVLAGPPLLIGVSRWVLLACGVGDGAAWVVSIAISTVVVGTAIFYLSQYEQKLLIEKELLSRERADAERARAEADARYRILADNAVDVVVHQRGHQVVWVSPSVESAFGWSPSGWVGSDFSSRIYPDDLGLMVDALGKIADDGRAIVRCRIANSEGGYHWVEVHGKTYVDAAGNADGVIAALRVIDNQVEAERQLERLARFDVLTGLVNRAETLARLELALAHSRNPGAELGVLFCDVDDFKSVNDTYGHTVGDAVLWSVADRISECVRHGDTVGRTGGDEMLVLLPGLHSLVEAVSVAEKIQARCSEPIHHSGETFYATLSIGVTLASTDESASAIMARADAAMYQAKRRGGDTVSSI